MDQIIVLACLTICLSAQIVLLIIQVLFFLNSQIILPRKFNVYNSEEL